MCGCLILLHVHQWVLSRLIKSLLQVVLEFSSGHRVFKRSCALKNTASALIFPHKANSHTTSSKRANIMSNNQKLCFPVVTKTGDMIKAIFAHNWFKFPARSYLQSDFFLALALRWTFLSTSVSRKYLSINLKSLAAVWFSRIYVNCFLEWGTFQYKRKTTTFSLSTSCILPIWQIC